MTETVTVSLNVVDAVTVPLFAMALEKAVAVAVRYVLVVTFDHIDA